MKKKTFFVKRTPEGTENTGNTLARVRRRLKKIEKRHGKNGLKVLNAALTLGAMYCVVEDYEKAEPLLKRCIALAKRNLPQNTSALYWAADLLAQAHFRLDHILESMIVSSEAKPLSGAFDPSAPNLVFELLWQLALSFDHKGDPESRKQGLAVALMALCWYVTRGLNRSQADAHGQEDLRLLFSTYGIVLNEWNWLVKHAHLTKYDFIGLLSIVLANADTSPVTGKSWMEREPRVHVVR